MKNYLLAAMLSSTAGIMLGSFAHAQSHHGHTHHNHGAESHKTHQHASEQPTRQYTQPSAEKIEARQSVNTHDHDHAHSDKPYYAHLDIRIHADSIVKAGEPDEEINEIYSHSHLEMGARLFGGFSLHSTLKLEGEPSGHDHGGGGGAANGKDRIFKEHPLAVEQLTLNYDNDILGLYAGKFNPVVAFDLHKFSGLYTYQTIEEYAILERIGIGLALKHDAGEKGVHRLDASTFFADTTPLSNSLLYKRGRTRKSSGGLANTEDFNSYAVSLGGESISVPMKDHAKLSYRFGYAKQAKGNNNDNDETRYSASLGVTTHLTDDITAQLIGEHIQIDHLGGEADHDRSNTTALIRLGYQQWNVVTAYTYIHNDAGDPDEGAEGNIMQISAGYLFDNGIGIDIGYQRADEENEVTKRIGAALSYNREF